MSASYDEITARQWINLIRKAAKVTHTTSEADASQLVVTALDVNGDELGHACFRLVEVLEARAYWRRLPEAQYRD